SSNSGSNFSMINLEMEYGSDVFRAASQADTLLNSIEEQLPEGTTTTTLSGGSADIPAMVVTMSSDLSPSELDAGFEQAARSDIENIPGVARAQLLAQPKKSFVSTPTTTHWQNGIWIVSPLPTP